MLKYLTLYNCFLGDIELLSHGPYLKQSCQGNKYNHVLIIPNIQSMLLKLSFSMIYYI